MPIRALVLCCLSLAPALAGCGDAMCDPNPIGAPWQPYAALLPTDAVVCGPNRVSARKPASVVDDYPPTHVFLFFKEANAPTAFDATIKRFEAAGWTLADMDIAGEGASAIYDARVTKAGDEIHFTVNENDWGTQGSFDLKTAAP